MDHEHEEHPVEQETISQRIARAVIFVLFVLALVVAGITGLACTKQDPAVNIGVLAEEDALPIWVADSEGFFSDLGMEYSVETYTSEVELITALTSGEIEYAVTDPVIAIKAFTAGTDVKIEWVALGRSASQGRYGIVTLPEGYKSPAKETTETPTEETVDDTVNATGESDTVAEAVEALTSTERKTITTLSDLSGARVTVATSTIDEYVLDGLLRANNIDATTVTYTDQANATASLESLKAEETDAAVLPAAELAQAQAEGLVVLADDTAGDNLSISVVISRTAFLEKEGGEHSLEQLKEAWERAAMWIAYYPIPSREILAEHTGIPTSVAETNELERYPVELLPEQADIDAIIAWMTDKGYLTVGIAYDEATGKLTSDL